MKFCVATLLAFTIPAHAKSACELLDAAKQSIAVHAANYVNAETARTSRHIECKLNCKVIETNEPVNKQEEYSSISAYAQILRRLHNECPEKARVVNGKMAAMILYKNGPVKLDIFDFKDDWNLSSWMRESTTGESKTLNF